MSPEAFPSRPRGQNSRCELLPIKTALGAKDDAVSSLVVFVCLNGASALDPR